MVTIFSVNIALFLVDTLNIISIIKLLKHLILLINFTEDDESSVVDQCRLRQSTEEIQNLVLAMLNKTIAEKLTSSILSLRETYLGTLQRYDLDI